MTSVRTHPVLGTETPMPGDQMTSRQRLRLILVVGSMIAVAPLTIDMYLPALPSIERGLLTTSTAVQLTLTGTLAGLALGQILVGPISDAVGRRVPMLVGLAVHVVASALCAVAPNIWVLGALRVMQGLGVAAALVVAVAVVRDLFSGTAFAKIFSRLMLVMGTAPILAPTLGSGVLQWTSWRGVFVVLGLFGLVLAITAGFALPETLPPARRRPAQLRATIDYYGVLLRDRAFVGMVLVTGLAMSAVFAQVAGSPFVYQDQFGLSEQQFGIAFGAGAAGLIISTQLNVRLLRRYTPQQILVVGVTLSSVAGLVLLGFAATGIGGLFGVMLPLWLVLAGAGLVLPNAPALAMSRHGEGAGTAGSLLGAAQFGLGAVAAPAVGMLGSGATAMAIVIAGPMALAALILLLVLRTRPAAPAPEPAIAPVH